MAKELDRIISGILDMTLQERYDLILSCYRMIREDFSEFDMRDSALGPATPALASLAAVNGEVTYAERVAVRKVLAFEGIEMDDNELRAFFLRAVEQNSFCRLVTFSKTLDDDKRAALFTFVAAICSCDNCIDEKEYLFLYDLVTD